MSRAPWTAVLAVLLAACGAAVQLSPFPGDDWGGPDGSSVSADVVEAYSVAEECDAPGTAFLFVSWPLPGLETDERPERRQYVRDPSGVFAGAGLQAPYDGGATLPDGAGYTGFHSGDVQLWVGPDADRYLYLVRGATVEAWSRVVPEVACR